VSPHQVALSPRGPWQIHELAKMLSPPVLAVAVEANINAQLPLIYAQMPGYR